MIAQLSEEAEAALRLATKMSLVPIDAIDRPPILDRGEIEEILPHRDPFLFLDEVLLLDRGAGLVVARHDLLRAKGVLEGHFPGHPVWPGVLQVEAIGQAGALLYLRKVEVSRPESLTVTHVLGARFIRPVVPERSVEFAARTIEDGLFCTIIGQCLQCGEVCSIAAVSILASPTPATNAIA